MANKVNSYSLYERSSGYVGSLQLSQIFNSLERMGAISESDIKVIIHHGSQGQSKLYVTFILSINLQFLLPE